MGLIPPPPAAQQGVLTGVPPGVYAVAMLLAGVGALSLPGKWGFRVLLAFLFITVIMHRRAITEIMSQVSGLSAAALGG